MRQAFFGVIVLLLLDGCMTAANVSTLPPERVSTVKTVGVISVIGDTLGFGERGLFRFDNKDSSPDITSWKLDDFICDQIKASLKPDLHVVTASYPPAQLNVDDIHWTNDPAKAVAAKLRALMRSNPPDVDLWLVVMKQEVSFQNIPHYGLDVTVVSGFGSSAFAVNSIGAIAVLDGKSLEPLAFADLRYGKAEFMNEQYPSEVVDEPAPTGAWDQTPESWRQKVRTKFEAQLKRAIAYTIPALGLGR